MARALEADLPHASLVSFDTDDHWAARQFAADVAQAIASFVRTEVTAR